MNVVVSLPQILRRHQTMFGQTTGVSTRALKAVKNMVSSASFAQQSTGARYDPQSGQIFGVLKQMKEDFETNLGNSQKEETGNVAAYEELKAAKTSQIAAAQDQVDTKSTAKEDLEETQANLAADNKFLEDLML